MAAGPKGRKKAENTSEAAGAPSGVSVFPNLLLGVLHLGSQPLDHAIQVIELILGSAEVLALLGHCGLHLLALWVGRQTANDHNMAAGCAGMSLTPRPPPHTSLASLLLFFCNCPTCFSYTALMQPSECLGAFPREAPSS